MHLKTSLTVACLIYLAIGNAHGGDTFLSGSVDRNSGSFESVAKRKLDDTLIGDHNNGRNVRGTYGVNKINAGDFEGTDSKVKLKNNKINLSMVKSQLTRMLEPELARRLMAAFESCKETPGEEGCELAFNFTKCLYEADKEVQCELDESITESIMKLKTTCKQKFDVKAGFVGPNHFWTNRHFSWYCMGRCAMDYVQVSTAEDGDWPKSARINELKARDDRPWHAMCLNS
ncbi:hypothetical protein AAG570_008565 [Ranatra chinensis]|uniref:Uncharacterized protein n=1 Tax=Ranatra chinensis TaxID=642074 RepID=A0ABD0Z464_9HEMI